MGCEVVRWTLEKDLLQREMLRRVVYSNYDNGDGYGSARVLQPPARCVFSYYGNGVVRGYVTFRKFNLMDKNTIKYNNNLLLIILISL